MSKNNFSLSLIIPFVKYSCVFFIAQLLAVDNNKPSSVAIPDDRAWKTLAEDGLHDPTNPALKELQNPGEALSILSEDFKGVGNQVDWVRAMNKKLITPRSQIDKDAPLPTSNLDIILPDTGEMAMVRFPHKAHTDWLDCSNCHPRPFKAEYNSNPINMFAILAGGYCGQCHGAVAFPLTECRRCHSVSRKDFKGQPGPQPEPAKIYLPAKKQKVQ